MNGTLSLSEFARMLVNVDENLFKKYEKGITSHVAEYLKKFHPGALNGDQVTMDNLDTTMTQLRENYMVKCPFDYSIEDSAALILTNHNLYTPEYVSCKSIQHKIKEYLDDSPIFSKVFIKRSSRSGKLIPCLNQEFLKVLLAEKKFADEIA